MSLLSDNVIPGNHGKVFGTNATDHENLEKIKDAILVIDGIKDVIIKEDVFPRELTVHTTQLVSIKDIEDAVIKVGFHTIPKHHFPL